MTIFLSMGNLDDFGDFRAAIDSKTIVCGWLQGLWWAAWLVGRSVDCPRERGLGFKIYAHVFCLSYAMPTQLDHGT